MSTLKKLAIISRHGDRAPIRSYPNDPYQESCWPDGWKQLTMKGKRRMLNLGKFLRRRYSDFLSDDWKEVSTVSSPFDRCIQSAQCVLTGLYPPTEHNMIQPDLKWQPIPIQISAQMLDNSLHCPVADAEEEKFLKSDEYLDYMKTHESFLQTLTHHTGKPMTTIFDVMFLCNCLHTEKQQGWPLPEWVTEDVFKTITEIGDKAFYFYGLGERIQRLKTGLLFKEIVDNFENRGKNKKLLFYSTHDGMISVVLQAMNLWDGKWPPYGSTIIFELHEEGEDSFVKAFYLKDTESEELIPLKLQGCDDEGRCSRRQFSDALQHLLFDDWKKESGML